MKNMFIVLIINNKYIRWEEVRENFTLKELFTLLKNKYNIINCMINIDNIEDIVFMRLSDDKLTDLCNKKNDLTLKIMTKNKKYKLSKDIF
jgi:hypothetical protein